MSLNMSGLMGNFGVSGLYKPKEQKLRVGTELAPISASSVSTTRNDNNMVVAGGDDVRFNSLEILSKAKSAAQSGFQVKNFRSVDIRNQNLATKDALYETSSHKITFSEGQLSIYEKDTSGKIGDSPARIFKITDDARLVRGEDGSFNLLQGAEARTNGKLQALGANEILIHKSGVDVMAGTNTTVLNLSNEGSSFSGGENVTYLGAYEGASITGGAGKTVYAGYFANANIEAVEGIGSFSGVFENSKIKGWNADEFSGYFSSVEITGGDGENVFKGMFLNNSTLIGGEGNDNFNGRFIDSKVDGGAGNDKFGNGSAEKNNIVVRALNGNAYYGIAADFIDSEISAGEGDDKFEGVMYGGDLDMGNGDDEAAGVFSKATVLGGSGDDAISATYSQASVFDAGEGKDSVKLATSAKSSIISGSGENELSIGANMNDAEDEAVSGVTWQTSKEYWAGAGAMASGALNDNEINSEQGASKIDIYNGLGVNSLAGDAAQAVDGTGRSEAARSDDSAEEPTESSGRGNPQSAVESSPGEAQNVNGQTGDGDPALQTGHVAVTVNSGLGRRQMFRGVDLPEIEITPVSVDMRSQNQDTIGRVTRRSNGFGGYDWVKSLS